MTDALAEAVYTAYDAKCHAELTPGVGFDCDIWILRPGQEAKAVRPETITLMSDVFEAYPDMPLPDRSGSKPRPAMPENWLDTLRGQLGEIAGPAAGAT